MASVYRATSAGGHIVAIKVLNLARVADRTALWRFEQEVSLGVSLQHPNIVKVVDYSLNDTAPFIVMEYVPGESLDRRLARGKTVAPRDLVPIISDVAAALDYAHSRGVIHRDVKPSNIIVRSDGRAQIADFGIAKASGVTAFTATQARVGSVFYMSPEQADGVPVLTSASDIYSLGVTAFHALTGRQPFVSESEVAVARMHMDVPPPHLEAINPSISKALCGTVLATLEKTPTRRPRTAGAFAASFARAVALPEGVTGLAGLDRYHQPVRVPPPVRTVAVAKPSPLQPRFRRFKLGVLAVGAVATLGAAGALLLFPAINPTNPLLVPATRQSVTAQSEAVTPDATVNGNAVTTQLSPTPRGEPAPTNGTPLVSPVVSATQTADPALTPTSMTLSTTPTTSVTPTAAPTATPIATPGR